MITKKRVGAPTKPAHLRKKSYTARLKPWLHDWINGREESGSVLIETALRKTYGAKPPE